MYRWRTQHRQATAQGTTCAAQRTEAEELTRLKRELARVAQERDFLQRAAAGYYAWRSRPESARSVSARTVLAAIRVIHQASRKTYGSPSIWDALLKQGHRIGEHRVARLMCQAGLRAKTGEKWRATTQSQHRFPVAVNILNRQFAVESPNRGWVGDLTYVWTTEGWLYLAVILDLYSRRVVGWAMGHRLTVELAEQALPMALANGRAEKSLLQHAFFVQIFQLRRGIVSCFECSVGWFIVQLPELFA